MSSNKLQLLTPTGRLVRGSLYDAQDKDMDGRPLVTKTGVDAGRPRVNYYFAVAFEKKPGEAHWGYTEWGAKILAYARAAWPKGQTERTDFAWKITDGDSAIPNKRGNKPCDNEGYPGHWIVNFSSSYPPRIVNANGMQAITAPNAVKVGYFVQVWCTIDSNESDQTAGIYINHDIVALQGYGPEIITGVNPAGVGFGQGPAPAGMSATPPAAISAPGSAPPPGALPPAGMPPLPGSPGLPPARALPPPGGMPASAAPLPPQTAVQPHPAILVPPNLPPAPGVTPMPPAPPVAPALPQYVMTAKAGGQSREAFLAASWTDAQLLQHGYMLENRVP